MDLVITLNGEILRIHLHLVQLTTLPLFTCTETGPSTSNFPIITALKQFYPKAAKQKRKQSEANHGGDDAG